MVEELVMNGDKQWSRELKVTQMKIDQNQQRKGDE